MLINLNGEKFSIKWDYADVNEDEKHIVFYKKITKCSLYKDSKALPHAIGYAWCSQKDTFLKEKGRKVSLSRAIQFFTKAERKIIWEQYLNRKGRKDGASV